jgi:hypothetical protein
MVNAFSINPVVKADVRHDEREACNTRSVR